VSSEKSHNGIGTLRESSLHAALKERLKQPGDQCEVNLDGYMIDLVRQDDTLVEIQTGSFSHIRRKLENLLHIHTVQLVYPIAENKWIVRKGKDGKQLRRRKSPKHGKWIDVFTELVYITDWITHPNFNLMLVKTEEDEIWEDDGKGSWRRKYWSKTDRKLLDILEGYTLEKPEDYITLLPENLSEPFTTRQLSETCGCRMRLAQQMAYTLFNAGLLERTGKSGRSHLYQKTD